MTSILNEEFFLSRIKNFWNIVGFLFETSNLGFRSGWGRSDPRLSRHQRPPEIGHQRRYCRPPRQPQQEQKLQNIFTLTDGATFNILLDFVE